MSSVSRRQFSRRSSTVAVLGICAALIASVLTDPFGLSTIALAYGIGITIACAVCFAIDSPAIVRYFGAFVALVATQLLLLSGVLRFLGILGLLSVLGVAIVSRLE